ncbi:MAG: hypothetical protein NVSMB19_26500 [Vulcanimicrobiaceae bacterium]
MKPIDAADAAEFMITHAAALPEERRQAFVEAMAPLAASARSGGDDALAATNRIVELATSDATTRALLNQFLDVRARPDAVRAYEGPPGSLTPVLADKYDCPQGDYPWYRSSVGVPIPVCPTHKVRLVRADA